MQQFDRVYLCGFMGAGKSTIGRALAQRLELPFQDLDDIIVEKAGKAISSIFADSGEAKFRILERKSLLEVSDSHRGVLALGGGSLQNQQVLDHLKSTGLLVFIEAPLSLIIKRISDDEGRPMLLDDHGKPKEREQLYEDMELLYESRLPLYSQAHIIHKVEPGETAEQQAKTLISKITNYAS